MQVEIRTRVKRVASMRGLLIAGVFVALVALSGGNRIRLFFVSQVASPAVLADDEGDERDEEGDDNEEGSSRTSSSSKSATTTRTVYVTTYKQVERTVTVLPEEYKRDTDGDSLVDALDPHPTVPEKQYFTDDDGDAVANAFDRYPGEDDLLVQDDTTDQNGDGILDAFANASLR